MEEAENLSRLKKAMGKLTKKNNEFTIWRNYLVKKNPDQNHCKFGEGT